MYHLFFTIYPVLILFGLTNARLANFYTIATRLLKQAHLNRRLVEAHLLRHFFGVPVSFMLANPLARLYRSSFYYSLKLATGKRVRLVHEALLYFKRWKQLRLFPSTRYMNIPTTSIALRSDASSTTGKGGTLGYNIHARAPVILESRGLWDPQLRF